MPAENYWFRRHEVVYEFLAPLVAGQRVLEVGCGEGYGTALLARSAARIVGVDYDAAAAAHAARSYPAARIARANLAALPVPSASFDALVTLQVIEHVWNHAEFVGECRRAVRPGGRLMVSTPNRLTFSPGRERPLNPFHTKEFAARELTELLACGGFEIEAVLGLHAGTRLTRWDAVYGGSFVDAQLAAAPQSWDPELLRDVASVTTSDFAVLAADVHEVDEALDLLVLARRPPGPA